MNSQSNGRSQRPKGKRVKLAIQIVSVLAVCLWLLYQAKQSRDKDYSGSVQNEVIEKHGSGILGRKANAGGSILVGESLNDEDRGGGVDVLDGNVEEKHKVNDDGDLGRPEGKESEKKVELIYKELNNTDDNSDIELKANSEAVGLDENSLQEGNSQVGYEDKQVTMSDQDGEKDAKNTSHHEVGEDEEQISHVNRDEQDMKGTHRKRSQFNGNGVRGFDDENGVPVDGNDIIESRATESSGDGEISSHEEMYSTSNSESTQSEEVVVRGDNADFEARSKISVQDSGSKAETNSEASVQVDTSRINNVTGTIQGGTSVSDL
ncbi:smoothelin-like protein 1 [Rosa chinensis]|uniref:smoothelin-like protein 1 n=1 Tax=Rosa chinensis TaxID=74649 RepID=UPI000D08AEDC|nr:smoothelin-like protein 1 [Rosa chinensis]